MEIIDLKKVIKANQKNLPIILKFTKKSKYIEVLRKKNFYISNEHQTNKHLFRRLMHKTF